MASSIALTAAGIEAGTFVDSEVLGADLVVHPLGYDGSGGELLISVCIDPDSANAAAMAIPTQHAVAIWNSLVPTLANVESASIPVGKSDFESVLLHELGHTVFALGHPNLGTDTGILSAADPVTNFTKTTKGEDTTFDIDFDPGSTMGNEGPDDTVGSHDDTRGDDVNLHWFEKGVNNPFQTVSATVDSTTYSRDLADLPAGDTHPANGDLGVSSLPRFDVAGTEAVMQQGTFTEETQRTLVADDIATVRYAMTGVDEVAGTADDYTVTLEYSATAPCDIVVSFDNSETLFAKSILVHNPISGAPPDHRALTSSQVFFNELQPGDWFFSENQPPNVPANPTPDDGASEIAATPALSWSGGDLDPGNAVVYDVFLEKDDPDPDVLVCDDIGGTTCTPSALDEGSAYYWKVVATDNHGETTVGPIWAFFRACAENLVLENTDITVPSIFRAAATIHVGPSLVVKQSAGEVTLIAGESVIFHDGFKVESGARFVAKNSPECFTGWSP